MLCFRRIGVSASISHELEDTGRITANGHTIAFVSPLPMSNLGMQMSDFPFQSKKSRIPSAKAVYRGRLDAKLLIGDRRDRGPDMSQPQV